MVLYDSETLNALDASVKELQRRLNLHCCLVADMLEGNPVDRNLPSSIERRPKRNRTLELKAAIKEAIAVLEESRRAFKSKKLESLRKRLTGVLIEADQH